MPWREVDSSRAPLALPRHRHPAVDRQGQTLQADAQGPDLPHGGVVCGKEGDEPPGEEGEQGPHDRGADNGCAGGEAVAVHDPVIAPGSPVEPRHRLEPGAKAQNDAKGEHHDLVGHADARQHGVGDAAGDVVEHNGRHHGQPGAEHGGGAHGDDLVEDAVPAAEGAGGDAQGAAAGEVGEDEDGEADQLGNGRGHGGPRHPQVQDKDKDGVQQAVEYAAEAHADHGQHGAALRPQALVHHKAGGHERGHQHHVGGVIDGVLLTGLRGPQQADHWGHEGGADQGHQQPEAHGDDEGRGQDAVGLVLPPGPQEPGDVAGRAHSQHGPGHHDDLVQGGVDADGGGGVGAQGADEVGVRQTVDGRDEKGDDGRHRHPGDDLGQGVREHHVLPAVLPGLSGFCHGRILRIVELSHMELLHTIRILPVNPGLVKL